MNDAKATSSRPSPVTSPTVGVEETVPSRTGQPGSCGGVAATASISPLTPSSGIQPTIFPSRSRKTTTPSRSSSRNTGRISSVPVALGTNTIRNPRNVRPRNSNEMARFMIPHSPLALPRLSFVSVAQVLPFLPKLPGKRTTKTETCPLVRAWDLGLTDTHPAPAARAAPLPRSRSRSLSGDCPCTPPGRRRPRQWAAKRCLRTPRCSSA